MSQLATNSIPAKPLLRAREVLAWLKIPAEELEKWVRVGLITRHHPTASGRGYYRTREIAQKILGE